MDTLNILVLHRLGDPDLAPLFLRRHVFALQTYCPQHNYVYHDTTLSIPEFIRDVEFDAIILDVTLLCARWDHPSSYRSILQDNAFVATSSAVKIAFPQDEYDCHSILDTWMCDWNVDIVFSVIPLHRDVLYPQFHEHGEIRPGFTGYIEDALIDMSRVPFHERSIDIGYRARRLPPYFGFIGENKWQVGVLVAERALAAGLHTDIMLGDGGTLLGQHWLDFINQCKFTLGANSGSSLLDPYGEIQRAVLKYLREFPQATFAEVESRCFAGLDGRHVMTAISPRVIEAGLLESCQILVEGEYSQILEPWQHYIPIKSDVSDFDQVLHAMQDLALVDRLRRDCRSALLDHESLRASNSARLVIGLIAEKKAQKGVTSDCDLVKLTAQRYLKLMLPRYRRLWRTQATRRGLHHLASKYPPVLSLARSLRSLLRQSK